MTRPVEDAADIAAEATHSSGTLLSEAMSSEQKQTMRRCLLVLGVLATGSWIGVASSLYLMGHFPLLLVALSPLGRHLVMVAPVVNPAAVVAVIVARRMLFYLSSFHLGRALGPAGIPWIERRAARFGRFVRWMERLFARAPRLVVFAMAGPTTSALAGVLGMRTRTFVPLAIVSIVIRALLMLRFAEWIGDYIEIARAWTNEYWLPGTVVMVIAMGLYRWRRPPAKLLPD